MREYLLPPLRALLEAPALGAGPGVEVPHDLLDLTRMVLERLDGAQDGGGRASSRD
jgi:hypothetical protein